MSNTGVAYNPDDPLQAGFLSALSLGETSNVANSATIGTGGRDLSNLINSGQVDQYGFPQWGGNGGSTAAGTYQFIGSTWDTIAQEYHLDFNHPGDQAMGAWQLAQQTDPNLYAELQAGNYSAIQDKLKNVWTSVTGNGAAPQGLAVDIAANVNTNSKAQAAQTATNNSSGGTQSGASGSGNAADSSHGFAWYNPGTWAGAAVGTFTQGALIVIGAVIIFVGLWWLLASQGVVPSAKQVGKTL